MQMHARNGAQLVPKDVKIHKALVAYDIKLQRDSRKDDKLQRLSME